MQSVTPRDRRRSDDAAAALIRERRNRRRGSPAVLVVDDDPDARAIYSDYLRSKGWVAFTAADGRVAIEKANAVIMSRSLRALERNVADIR